MNDAEGIIFKELSSINNHLESLRGEQPRDKWTDKKVIKTIELIGTQIILIQEDIRHSIIPNLKRQSEEKHAFLLLRLDDLQKNSTESNDLALANGERLDKIEIVASGVRSIGLAVVVLLVLFLWRVW